MLLMFQTKNHPILEIIISQYSKGIKLGTSNLLAGPRIFVLPRAPDGLKAALLIVPYCLDDPEDPEL